MGNRSSATAPEGHQHENALSSLSQSPSDGKPAQGADSRLQMGSDGSNFSGRRMNSQAYAVANVNSDSPLPADVLSVNLLSREEGKRWDDFVSCCPEATFFHRAGWQTVIGRAFGHKSWFLYAESGGEIQGVLPLAEINSSLFGHSLSSLPFCVYGGIAANSEAVRDALDRSAQKLAQELQVDYLEYRNLKPYHVDWHGKDLYVTFRKEIAPEVEQNMNAIPRKQRAMVRKGIKAGLESAVDQDIERFFSA